MPDLDLTGWTVAFDLDGTLIDTAPDLCETLNSVLEEDGVPTLPIEETRHMVGHGAWALIQKGYAAAGKSLPDEKKPEMVERFIDLYLPRIARHSLPYDGCLETLDTLRAAGANLVVCTNKRTDLSLALLKQLGMTNLFSAIIGADAAPAPKPDARHLLFAIEEGDGDPDMAVMIGDSRTDLGAARNAGIPIALFSFGYSDVPQRDLGADIVLDHYSELADWISGLASSAATT